MEDKYTLEEFGQMIKSKYPDYEDLDNLELANRMLEKYPTYQDMIVKKKDSSASKLQNPFMAFMPDSEAGSTDLDFTQVTNPDPQGEKNFIGGSFGDLLNSIPGVGDFVDDTARAIYVGQGQSANIDKTFGLMAGGVGVERETVESYVNAANDWQSIQDTVGPSDEMQEFQKTYAESGNSAFGFIKGLAQNPTILPEVFFQSMAGMANKVSLTEGAAVLGGGAAVGSVVPGVGTAAGLLTAMPAALGVMGGTLETASSFSEFLREELGEREFNTDNVLAVMQDPDAYSRMRNKSIARGAVTGAFDTFGGKLVSSVGGKVLAKTGSKLKTTGTGLAIESVSGGAGEVTARAVTGQEQDVAETGFEMFAGTTTAPISVGAVLLNPPKYSINKGASNRNEVIDVINTATPDQIKDGILDRISVKNDKEVSTLIEGKKLISEVDSEIDPRVKGEDRSKLVKLELERKKYADSKLKSSKNRLQEIDSQIGEITNRAVEAVKVEPIDPKQPEPVKSVDPSAQQEAPVQAEVDRKKLYTTEVIYDIVRGAMDSNLGYGGGVIKLRAALNKLNGAADMHVGYSYDQSGSVAVRMSDATDFIVDDIVGSLRIGDVSVSDIEAFANKFDQPLPEPVTETVSEPTAEVAVEEGKPKEAPVQPEVVETAEEADIKITEGEVGDTFTSNRGEEKVVIKTKNQTVTQSTTETINPADQRRFGLKSVTDVYRKVYGEKMDGTEPVPNLNVYPEKSLATGKKVTQQAEPTEAPAKPEAPQPSEPDVSLQESKPKSQMSQLERFFYRNRRDITLGGKQYDKFSSLRKLKASWEKTFKSNSGLKPEVGEVYRQLNRDVAAYSDKINVEAGAINDLRNKASKKASEEVTNERYELMNQYLQGNKDVNLDFLNEEDLKVLDYSRDKIDSLSVRIIDVLNARIQEGNLKGEQLEATQSLIETITANDGQYIKRTYQAFTDPEYIEALTIPRDQMNAVAGKKFDDAVSYLEEVEGYTYENARSEIVKYIDGIANKTTSELGIGRAGSASAPFLRKKKDMPEVFKRLLGEAKDPLYNYANTTEKLSSFLASLDYQQLLSDTILETGIGSKTAKDGYTKFSPNSAEWSYLKDIYVPKEFKEAFDSLAPLGALDNGFYKALVNMASVGKLSKTVLSPTATFRNLYSGVLLGLNSGHLFALSPDRISNSVSMAWGPVRNNKQLQAEREQLIKLGVVGDAARSGELVSVLNDFSSLRADPSKQNLGRRTIEFAKQFYAFGDDFYKTIGFYQEKQKFMDSGMNEGQAAVKAAERIRGGYPTYSYIPTNIRKLRRNPAVGSFVSFPYEVVRTTKNNLLYAVEDLQAGRTKMGMSRIAGMVTATLGIGALSTASKNLLDLTDEDDENIRDIVPFYTENSELIYAGKDENSATFIDGTALFPSEAIIRPIRMILENPRDEDLGQRVVDAVKEVAAPYIGLDLTTKTGFELFKNENSFGSKIYDEGDRISGIPLLDGVLNDAKGMFNYLLKKAGPGVYNNLQELAIALELNPEYFGEKINRYKEYTVENALFGLLGFRVSTANYYQGVSGKIREEKEIQIEAQSAQVGSLSSSRLMSEEEISSAFDSYSRYNKRFQDKAIGFAKTGRSLGMSEDRIIGSLIGGGMSKKDANTAANGGYAPLSVVSKNRYTKKIKSIRSQEDVYGKEKTDEMVSLYKKNVEVFNNLVKEYEIKVPDIIKN